MVTSDKIPRWLKENNKLKKADREALGIEGKEQEAEYIEILKNSNSFYNV